MGGSSESKKFPGQAETLPVPATRTNRSKRTDTMRKITAIAVAFGFLASVSLPAYATPAASGVVKSDDLSAAKKKKSKKMDKKDEKKSKEKKSELGNDLSADKKKKKKDDK